MTTAATEKSQVNLLVSQLKLAKGVLMRSLDGELTEAHWAHQSLPCRLNISWIVGHLASVLDRNFMKVIGGTPRLPDSHVAIFGQGTQPSGAASDYPSIAELTAQCSDAYDRYIAQVETLSDEDLAKPLPPEMTGPLPLSTIGEMIALAVIHNSYHTGQVSMLRRTQGLPTGLGR